MSGTDPLPGVVGPAARRRPRRRRSSRSAPRRRRPRPACSRRSPTRTSCSSRRPTRWCQHRPDPGRARHQGRRRGARPWSASPGSSAAPRSAAWPTSAWPRSACETSAAAVAAHYGAGPHRRLAGRRAGQGGGRRPGAGRHRGARAAAVHARPALDRGDRPGRHRPGAGADAMTPAADPRRTVSTLSRSPASPGYRRSRRATTWPRLIADAALAPGGPGLLDGDILVVTSKVVSKAEGRVVSASPRGRDRGGDGARGGQARARRRSRRPGTGS